ncbi:aminoglycoside phosphotransferase family protein [Hassallia byssoidea VB512170]|uniref:Aminoglycoside phosphotransferase family protein n=1 Tax=Hassallia byssoidea VB512170 TaxID=1304833 RepID=A0A846HB46_9CYAN|nr:aminoglycoside phosphotransferase family protein [Hassalia byssoidea]NEU73820.1 aminoglycoside phosphotransferase family protein [Hassalia byssoidea VB512170]
MVVSLSSHNVIQYLRSSDLCSSEDGTSSNSELPESKKNLNLLVTLADNRKLLVKQKRSIDLWDGKEQFFNEWLFDQLLEKFPVIGNIGAIASSVVHFDEENSILIRNYLSEYQELGNYYQQNDIFPQAIATTIGDTLGALHRATFNRREYRDFMATAPAGQFRYHFNNPAQGIESIAPEIFGMVPTPALKFYALYQKYDNLESAIGDLANDWQPCCLTHNDLKLDNILIHSRWEHLDNAIVRLIDWEACAWGDPAFDLGTLLASYLKIWLDSLVVDPTIELEESLQLAVTPLETLQPSMLALIQAYLKAFPNILEYRNDFLLRVIQFAGLALMHQIEATIKYDKYFDNISISMLQVAKNLLTMPQLAMLTVFGISESEILKPVAKLEKLPQPESKQNLLRLYYPKTRLRGC